MKVAVLGFGTVGVGVWDMLEKAPGLERGLVLVRAGKENEDFKVSSMEAICNDESIDAVAAVNKRNITKYAKIFGTASW